MKTNQITIMTITAVLLFALAGCGDHVDGDGKIVLKESRKPVSEMTPAMNWTINGPVDEAGNLIVLEEVE